MTVLQMMIGTLGLKYNGTKPSDDEYEIEEGLSNND